MRDIWNDLAFRGPSFTFKVSDQDDQSSVSAMPPLRQVCALKSRLLCNVLGLAPGIFVLLSSLRFMHFPSPPFLSSLYAAAGPQCPGDSFGGSYPEDYALISDSRMASRPSKPPTVIMRPLRTGSMPMLKEGPSPSLSSQSHASPAAPFVILQPPRALHRSAAFAPSCAKGWLSIPCPHFSPYAGLGEYLYSTAVFFILVNARK